MHRIKKLFLSILLTYFLQKFRKTAPVLVVFQLIAFCTFLVYQKYSEPKLPDLDGYGLLLAQDNSSRWGELEYDMLYFEHQISKERRGKDFLKGAKMTMKVVNEYLEKLNKLEAEMLDLMGIPFSDLTTKKQEELLLQMAKENHWHLRIKQLLKNFQAEMEVVGHHNEQILGRKYWLEMEKIGYYEKEAFDKLGLNETFQYDWQVELALRTAETILLDYAQKHVSGVLGGMVIDGIAYDYCHARVLPLSQMVYEGDVFEAEILLVKEDNFKLQAVSVEGKGLKPNDYGSTTYKAKLKGIGTHTFNGSITTKNRVGVTRTYNFKHEYTVLPKCN